MPHFLKKHEKKLGRVASNVAKKLIEQKKYYSRYPSYQTVMSPMFVNILNTIELNKRTIVDKKYYRNSQRPGSLKIKTSVDLAKLDQKTIVVRAISNMLPKNKSRKKIVSNLYSTIQ
jgi:ribosomal protein L13